MKNREKYKIIKADKGHRKTFEEELGTFHQEMVEMETRALERIQRT